MKPILGLIALVCLFNYLKLTESLDCYQCLHVDGISDDDIPSWIKHMYSIHKSCKSGKTPDNEYSSKCQRSGNTTKFSCAKFAGEGNIGDKKVKITSRNCIQFKEDETCGKTSTAAIKEELELPQEVGDFLEASKFSFSVCTCNSGDCNSGLKLKVLQYLVFMSVCISKINSYFSL